MAKITASKKLVVKATPKIGSPDSQADSTVTDRANEDAPECTAKETGHSACKCGGNYCGDNVTG